ncbi:MAG: DUF2851 family protein [Dehalococcoidales bacterium]|nr:DUF2851 family protein [Dehalococcoidales bacterium]
MSRIAEADFSGKTFESQVSQLWQRQLMDKVGLATEDGQSLDVIYPGRPNDDRGADFRDAVISANRILLRGDIEVHVRSSDWYAHGHDRDPCYNSVILHVVLRHNSHRATSLQNGRDVPVLALEKYISFPPSSSQGPPCVQAPPEAVAAFLDEAGEARFLGKADRFSTRLSHNEAAQVFFEGIMEALGYVKNSPPFLELARRLPLNILESVAGSSISDKTCLAQLQTLLLSTAGLVPPPPCSLELPIIEPMSSRVWQQFKVRPQNSPGRRLVAMSHLLLRYRKRGLLHELTGKLITIEGRQQYDTLEKAFMVGLPSRRVGRRSLTLLGRERAAVIVINVLLPFSYAWGLLSGRPGLMQRGLDLYRHYPVRTMNSIEKHMVRQLGLSRKLVSSAHRQQGLIHIYKELCIQGKCGECALNQLQSG